MKFSFLIVICLLGHIILFNNNGLANDKKTVGNKKLTKDAPKPKDKDFCSLAVELLGNCNTDFKKIRTKMVDSFKSDSETTIAIYESGLIIPGSVSTSIYWNNFEGYSYDAIMVETDDVKIFQDTYNKYMKLMSDCKGIHLEYTDSTEGRYVKGYPELAFIKKGEKNPPNDAFPNSIRLQGECKDGLHYSVSIWVYVKRK